jgi:putative Holliday junction resolvase
MRLLAVDFGSKRIGIAVGDSGPQLAAPRPNLAASGTLARDAEAIEAKMRVEGAEAVVIGLPLGAEGEATAMSRICEKLALALEARGIIVHRIDESLTSRSSLDTMRDAGLKGSERRKRRDGEAACRILERFWLGP